MKKLTVPLLLAVVAIGTVVAGGYYFAAPSKKAPAAYEQMPRSIKPPTGRPVFEWGYEESVRGDIPYSKIILTALYPDKTIVKKEIDDIAGGCNKYDEKDADAYESSTMIVCYYAGLGHYYKVVESGREYLVKRKVFEEASPEYTPAPEQFEIIAWF